MRICKWHSCNNEVIGRTNKKFCSPQCNNKFFVDKRRKELKLKVIEFLGGKCNRCGWAEHPSGLDVHHLNPNIKEFGIGSSGSTRSWTKIKNEITKCKLLCSCCHRVVHATNDPKWIDTM